MKDYLVKALAYDDKIRIYAIRSTDMVKEAARRHDTWRTVTAALGRALTAGTMMGCMLKGDEKLTVKIEGNGPASPIIVDAQAQGSARGYVTNSHVDPERYDSGKLNVAAAVGTEGSLSVVKDLGMRDHFTGNVPLVSGELGEDFTYYFATSEQTPSSVGLGVVIGKEDIVEGAGGFILQIMPGADDEILDEVESRLQALPPVSSMIRRGDTPEQIVEQLAGSGNYRILETKDTWFECQCSKERIVTALYSLDDEELSAMIHEDGGAETTCHFCREQYWISKEELENILSEKQSASR
ncbi:Hsp33 family molecular chaperone HslO [Alkalicoccus urumqiensis]|uniref:33 kDa chaperonin n=1 Tax=Alkalicoccus urumqiensis TaxID=1548213 RepID=A0A2P6MDQ6_ALKUR|nr:Hsp33 family molecular chaperone HslO [Alkalicoccus urumqiensis]PRO64407.1 Hsp33 family molecular chaperone HslO [Alkalicoccus urumqiensis]